jgi:hypothetical protein
MKTHTFRTAALAAIFAVVLALSGCGGNGDNGNKKPPLTPGAKILTQPELQAEVAKLDYRVYWLGPRDNTEYEYTHRPDGRVYIRYLTPGTTAGSYKRFLTVGTYPMLDAYSVVRKISKLPDAERIRVRRGVGAHSEKTPQSVYVAFRGKDLEIEVYSPEAGAAVQEVKSNNLKKIPKN